MIDLMLEIKNECDFKTFLGWQERHKLQVLSTNKAYAAYCIYV
jgi:hypothetical protein